jgi:importin subunit beta-1
VSTAFGLILTQVQDDHPIVKETAIWTVAKICDICPETISEQHLPHVMRAVEIGLRDSPKIAALTCYAVHNLAAASDVDEDTQTCLLSPYFQGLVQLLWTTTERYVVNLSLSFLISFVYSIYCVMCSADAGENNLTDSAYNALSMLVQQATQDSLPCITAMLPGLLDRLRNTIVQAIQATAAHSDAASKFVRQQALICGVLQHMLRKLPESVVQGQADNIMMMILEALKGQTASVHEESLMVVSALANKIGADFAKYMPVFQPYLLQGLRAFNEAHLCIGAIGVVSDLLVSLGDKMLPMCNDIVQALITNLQVACLMFN